MTSPFEEVPPAAATIGRRVLDVLDGGRRVRLSYQAHPEFANRHGTVGGGFLAAMLDSASAAPLIATLPDEVVPVTTHLNVSFLRRVHIGTITATGRLVRQQDQHAETVAELFNSTGDVLARAETIFRIIPRQKTSHHPDF